MCSELAREPSTSQHLTAALCGLGRGKKLQGGKAERNIFFQALKCVLVLSVLEGMEPGFQWIRASGLVDF